jgi:non-heme chloroperoxidase
MSYIKTASGVNLFYEDWGTGQPVVLIHGWPLSHEMWEAQLTELPQQGLRCIAYDRRGFGKSSKPWQGYDYDSLADDLKAVLEELDLNDVILVGFSMGGGEVVRYLSKYGSSRVSKAVLLGAVTPFLLKTSDNPNGAPQEVFEGMIEKIREDRPAFLADFGKQFFGVNLLNHPVSQDMLDWCKVLALHASPRATIDCVRSFGMTDFRQDMGKVDIPTLIIHGSADQTVPIQASGDQSARMIPGAKYIVYDGAPHGFYLTEKERLNQDLLAFIKAPASRPSAASTY